MKYLLVEMGDKRSLTETFENEADLIDGMKARGYEHLGPCKADWLRAELRGQPVFKGIFGPMWDNNKVRYEDEATNDLLSR